MWYNVFNDKKGDGCVTKKYLKDLNNEELINVFHANQKLRDDIYDDMIETEMFYIGEQLDYLRDGLSDWNIGAYNRNYIEISDPSDFISALDAVEKAIPILIDKETPKLKYALELNDKYRFSEMYSDEYYELKEELEEVAEELADIVVGRFTDILDGCSKEEYQIDYFIEFYSNSRLDGDKCYINVDDGDYILYEDTVKVYN